MLKKFYRLIQIIRQDHKKKGALVGTGHDFAHALMVAQYAKLISKKSYADLAWVAGLYHNTDRIFNDYTKSFIIGKLNFYLKNTDFNDGDKKVIIEAVLNHSRKPNVNDNQITIALMDADKLANLGYLATIRAAQFRYSDPPIDLRYINTAPPKANYKNPGSVFWDIKNRQDWKKKGWFRLPKARHLAKKYFREDQQVINGLVKKFKEAGLMPYPFPKDFKK